MNTATEFNLGYVIAAVITAITFIVGILFVKGRKKLGALTLSMGEGGFRLRQSFVSTVRNVLSGGNTPCEEATPPAPAVCLGVSAAAPPPRRSISV